jgi:superoxide dismutase, Cu-Zn family
MAEHVDPAGLLCKSHSMHLMKSLAAASCVFALTACQTPSQQGSRLGAATIHLANATQVGTAILRDRDGKVELSVSLSGIEPGERAMHLHAKGVCVTPDFQSAGGHLNPHGKQHGAHNPLGSHLGDLPNIVVDVKGNAVASVILEGATPDLVPLLFDEDGTAIVVHGSPDDMVSDPAGNAGKRIACGDFKRG